MNTLAVRRPETRYAKLGEARIAYQVVGEGPLDIAYVPGFASSIDTQWDIPAVRRFFERMSSYARVIVFDRRGSGNSDRLPVDSLPTWEDWTEDLTAVLDAAGAERAAIVSEFESGALGMLFAASHPERTSALVLWNAFAKYLRSDDFPFGADPARVDDMASKTEHLWGTDEMVGILNPSLRLDPGAARAFARTLRSSASPSTAAAMYRYWASLDMRGALPLIRVPTLVLRRTHLPVMRREVSLHLASSIAGARYVEVPGSDLFAWAGDSQLVQDQIQRFLTGARADDATERVLATVLFTDIVGSTERAAAAGDRRWKQQLDEHERTSRTLIDEFRGRLVETTGDGLLAMFDGPGRAIRSAQAMHDAFVDTGLRIRSGVHSGEIELRSDDRVGGIAVHIGARVMSLAGAGEVVCSRTVKDLVAGSGFRFEDRGLHVLKGVPEQWHLYRVEGP